MFLIRRIYFCLLCFLLCLLFRGLFCLFPSVIFFCFVPLSCQGYCLPHFCLLLLGTWMLLLCCLPDPHTRTCFGSLYLVVFLESIFLFIFLSLCVQRYLSLDFLCSSLFLIIRLIKSFLFIFVKYTVINAPNSPGKFINVYFEIF